MAAFSANELILSQKTSLTPKMIEDLKILQMSNIELMQHVEKQLEENPLLEVEEDEPYEETKSEEDNNNDEEYGEDRVNRDLKAPDINNVGSRQVSLRQYLCGQLGERKLPYEYKRIALYLIESLNDEGFLTEDIESVALLLNASHKKVRVCLRIIQSFEPCGVGARNVEECLMIQLIKMGMLDSDSETVVRNYLKPLSEGKYNDISRKTGITKPKIIEIHERIKKLNPKPGLMFSDNYANCYIRPELEVMDIGGIYIVEFYNDSYLKLRISDFYIDLLRNTETDKDARRYIKERLAGAQGLIHSLEQRKLTILRVASQVINYQAAFLKKGYAFLKPLTMKRISEEVGLHESTVSRAIDGKYIQTPRGIFELKFFFSAQTDTSFCEDGISANGVKQLISGLIKDENKYRPLSDEQIREVLKIKGITVARRTIAKYRDELGILTAKQRKRMT